jgi:glucose-6-phosphate isomerase
MIKRLYSQAGGLMARPVFNQTQAYIELKKMAGLFSTPEKHIAALTSDPDRFKKYSLKIPGFSYDFSKQRVDEDVKKALICLAKETFAIDRFKQMAAGDIVNTTEKRAALHTAARDLALNLAEYSDVHAVKQMHAVNDSIKVFSRKVHNHTICGSTNKPITDAVIIGIGGSYLGCHFAYHALSHYMDPAIRLHFVPNVDIDNFGQVIKAVEPETALFIIISKSYTTTETMANLEQVRLYLDCHHLSPSDHLVTITSKDSPGDDPSNPVRASFNMFDFIGGRYSVTSAVGGLPLSLAFGFDAFEQFLNGCHEMDRHALNAAEHENMPLMAALISIWNSNFLNYPAQAIIPYSTALSKLAPHIQQVYMESLGKNVTIDGRPVNYPTGVIVFGEPGTNAQHSFFQLAHQGSAFPIEFIGIVRPCFNHPQAMSKGVYNHQELWANMLAQSLALARGKTGTDPARRFEGNRPSSTMVIDRLTPHSLGMLLSFYEARTVYEGFILGINPFDQYGVELGKVLATDIRQEMAKKNQDAGHVWHSDDPATRFYLDLLFDKEL